MAETKLKIAVFIDFDNIEIGVKTTLGAHFDVGAVLEAIKERGEVVTKIAYGDWTRAGDYSRSLTQHAIHMVQRNLTPGGDKNGADINLALDALEMAFTHSHINAFVIVSGDSDFMALVEKLKQYDRKVFVVGGRAFTSTILQKNCHEFIAYENLVGRRAGPRGRPQQDTPLTGAVTAGPPRPEGAHRSRSVAAARRPQEHAAAARFDVLGARVRRQHLPRLRAAARSRRLRHAEGHRPQPLRRAARRRRGRARTRATRSRPRPSPRRRSRCPSASRSRAADGAVPAPRRPPPARARANEPRARRRSSRTASSPSCRRRCWPASRISTSSTPPPTPRRTACRRRRGRRDGRDGRDGATAAMDATTVTAATAAADNRGGAGQRPGAGSGSQGGTPPPAADPALQADGYKAMERVFLKPGAVTRWPLYLRQAKAVLRAGDEGFDERKYGFAGLVEALRFGQREGLFRLDRDRQGVLRVYPGQLLQRAEGGGAMRRRGRRADASRTVAGTAPRRRSTSRSTSPSRSRTRRASAASDAGAADAPAPAARRRSAARR